MHKLLVAPVIQEQLTVLKQRLPHALLLHGESGVGLLTIANEITDHSAYVLKPQTGKGEPDERQGVITAEAIRKLYEHTRGQGANMHVIIDDADRMTMTAQNSLLKLLEEPPAHVHFVLTTHNSSATLPTIRSRTQQLHVPRISTAATKKLLDSHDLNPRQVSQLNFIANGRPAAIYRLLSRPEKLSQEAALMGHAKTFLSSSSVYEKATIAIKYAASQQSAVRLVDSCLQIIEHSLKRSPNADIAHSANRLLDSRKRLLRNASPRLQLMRIVVK